MKPEYQIFVSIIIFVPAVLIFLIRIYSRLTLYRELKQGAQENTMVSWLFAEGLAYLFAVFLMLQSPITSQKWYVIFILVSLLLTGSWYTGLGVLSIVWMIKKKNLNQEKHNHSLKLTGRAGADPER